VAVLVPVGASAGSTTGSANLSLSPTEGPVGTHFAATVVYSVPTCQEYSVDLFWDNNTYLASASDASSGQSCEVTLQAVVPSSAAAPAVHTVTALTHPRGVAAGGGPGPSATASFRVTQPTVTTTSHSASTTMSVARPVSSTSATETTDGTSPTDQPSPGASDAGLAQGDLPAEGSASMSSGAPSPSGDAPAPLITAPSAATGGSDWVPPLIVALLVGVSGGAVVVARRRSR
jgi:hypothetical protein